MFQRYYDLSQEKKDIINAIIIMILFLAVMFMLAWLLPDQGQKNIKQQLEARGYSVADINFARTI